MRSVRPAASAFALAVTALALAACAPEAGPSASPTPSVSAEATPGATRTPTPGTPTPGEPTPTPTPTADAGGLPADCEAAYSPAMVERLRAEFGQLNPDVEYYSTKVGDLADVIQGSTTLACLWTPPGQTALMTNASIVRAEHAAYLRDVLPTHFPGCEDDGAQLVCSRQAEQIQGAKEIEHVVLRGDRLYTTLALNTDLALVQDAVADMIAAIEG